MTFTANRLIHLITFAAVLSLANPGTAQEPSTQFPRIPHLTADWLPDSLAVARLPYLSGPLYELRRLEQMSGARGRAASGVLRSTSSELLSELPSDGGARWGILAPRSLYAWNSDLPSTFNDGDLRVAVGSSASVEAGAYFGYGPVTVILAPQFVHEQNSNYQTIAYSRDYLPERKPFASPFTRFPDSADLPQRFGRDSRTTVLPGQSSLTIELGDAAFGFATENLWWGPGLRNGLVMSDNAGGIPHLFLRSARPLETPLGDFEGRLILGRLEESDHFDYDPDNDVRSISAAAVVFRPFFEPALHIGAARAVYAVSGSGGFPFDAALDVFRNVGRPAAQPDSVLRASNHHDQLFSVFTRWAFPDAGFEVYGEWARFEQPKSIGDLLVSPNHSQGYTFGLQWAGDPTRDGRIRVHGELTYVEPSSTYRERPLVASYTSKAVPHGYTHRGRTVGAAIGPGSSAQWVSADYLTDAWRIGGFAQRIRWHTALLETQLPVANHLMHDVSLIGGLRGGLNVGPAEIFAEYAYTMRLNYLFQNEAVSLEQTDGVDVGSHGLRLYLRVR